MHPQIRQNEPGVCPICEMDLIPLGSAESSDPMVFKMTAESARLAQLRTVTVAGGDGIQRSLELNGIIREDERSMFHRVSNASKVALTHLVDRMRKRGFVLLDTQFTTDHEHPVFIPGCQQVGNI